MEENQPNKPQSEPNPKLYASNLPPQTSQAQIRQIFSSFGTITDVKLKHKPNNNTYVFVQFKSIEDASKALENLKETKFKDRDLRVDFARGHKQGANKNNGQGCYNCKGSGHFARQCPNQRMDYSRRRERSRTSRSRSPYQRRDRHREFDYRNKDRDYQRRDRDFDSDNGGRRYEPYDYKDRERYDRGGFREREFERDRPRDFARDRDRDRQYSDNRDYRDYDDPRRKNNFSDRRPPQNFRQQRHWEQRPQRPYRPADRDNRYQNQAQREEKFRGGKGMQQKEIRRPQKRDEPVTVQAPADY